jgi:hypothetical protein
MLKVKQSKHEQECILFLILSCWVHPIDPTAGKRRSIGQELISSYLVRQSLNLVIGLHLRLYLMSQIFTVLARHLNIQRRAILHNEQ